jgi:mRNA-degrading endonuclease RelE of RelBE toxin-antitoxin system
LSSKYRFLVHVTFQIQLDAFIGKHEGSIKSFISQVQSAVSDPLNSGKPLKDVKNSKLRGSIRRYHVGGREGFRLITLMNSTQKAVMPVFISDNLRANFDYDKIPWEEYAQQIYDDLINSKMENFREYQVPS